MNSQDFNNSVILITGAAGGFGTLLANHLASAGARLVLSDFNQEALEALTDSLTERGATVTSRVADVSKEQEVAEIAEHAVTAFGQLDIAINNAGLSAPMKPLVETTEEDLDRNFAVNAKGVLFGMKYQIPRMLQQGGGIILNVASMAGLGGAPKLAAYCAAKHAVVGLSRTAALEYGGRNIRKRSANPVLQINPPR